MTKLALIPSAIWGPSLAVSTRRFRCPPALLHVGGVAALLLAIGCGSPDRSALFSSDDAPESSAAGREVEGARPPSMVSPRDASSETLDAEPCTTCGASPPPAASVPTSAAPPSAAPSAPPPAAAPEAPAAGEEAAATPDDPGVEPLSVISIERARWNSDDGVLELRGQVSSAQAELTAEFLNRVEVLVNEEGEFRAEFSGVDENPSPVTVRASDGATVTIEAEED
jgi:hypothetical protein